jgi:exonuclease-1
VKRRVELLLFHKVRPIVVFDGGALPMKAATNAARRENRQKNHAKGLRYLEQKNYDQAMNCFRQAVSITFDMMKRVQSYLDQVGVDWIVAPYEADAQLAFLSRNGWVDAVITEDSDLLTFGCKTVLFKLDKTGQCKEVKYENLGNIEKPSLVNFDMDMFRVMCILSGCDYVESLPGIGLKKAHELIRRHRTLDAVLEALKADVTKTLPAHYEERVRLADLTFRHQRIWDHESNCLSTLTPMAIGSFASDDEKQNDYLGPVLSEEIAYGVSSGRLHPHSHQPYDPIAEAAKRTPQSAPARTQSNTISSYFTPMKKPKKATAPQRSAHSDTADRLAAFKKMQQLRPVTAGGILAPPTPERNNSQTERTPLLRTLTTLREAHGKN